MSDTEAFLWFLKLQAPFLIEMNVVFFGVYWFVWFPRRDVN